MDLENPELGMPESDDEWKLFRMRQPIIWADPKTGMEIRRRDIFEAKTVRGGTSLLVVLRIKPQWTYYLVNKKTPEGEIEPKCQKVSTFEFLRAVESGDIWLVDHRRVDFERFSKAFMMVEAFLNESTIEKAIAANEAEMANFIAQGGTL